MNNIFTENLTDQLYASVLENQSVVTLLQPIISIKKKSVIGFEALSRGITGNKMIPPAGLFNIARKNGTALEFDRLCRGKALETFSQFSENHNDYFISINIDSSVLMESGRSNHLLNMVKENNLNPSSIIIEILESGIRDIEVLKDFVERYKSHKFLIAIDDIGSGFSNLERVIELRPDVVKLDRYLVTGIGSNFYRQEVVKSIVSMTKGIGSIIIAEGIETADDAVACLELGADYLQGFYFSKPDTIKNLASGDIFRKIDFIANKFRDHMITRITARRDRSVKHDRMVGIIKNRLMGIDIKQANDFLKQIIRENPLIECAYLINDKGIQISDTIFNENTIFTGKKLFRPDTSGTDQSYKNYFFYLNSGLEKYTSDPYISTASGRLCITISTWFNPDKKNRYVFCCDINDYISLADHDHFE